MELEVLPGPSDAVDVVQVDDYAIASDGESVSSSGFRDGVHLRIEKPVPAVGGGKPHHLPRAVVAGDRFRFPRWHKAILLSFPVAHIPLLMISGGLLLDLPCKPPDDLHRGETTSASYPPTSALPSDSGGRARPAGGKGSLGRRSVPPGDPVHRHSSSESSPMCGVWSCT